VARRLPDPCHGAVELLDRAPRHGDQRAPLRRQRHVPRRPIEDAKSHLLLQLADRQAQRGGRHEQRLRGPRETVMVRDQQHRPQLTGTVVNHWLSSTIIQFFELLDKSPTSYSCAMTTDFLLDEVANAATRFAALSQLFDAATERCLLDRGLRAG